MALETIYILNTVFKVTTNSTVWNRVTNMKFYRMENEFMALFSVFSCFRICEKGCSSSVFGTLMDIRTLLPLYTVYILPLFNCL